MSKKVVFLYTELAPYIIKCLEALASEGVEVHVIAYPVNSEAPFHFNNAAQKVQYHNRNDFNQKSILNFLDQKVPDLIVSSGWIDKGYIGAIKSYSGRTRKIIALDNQLEKGLKAQISAIRAKALYAHLFDCAWVPGQPQVEFAKSIGFDDKNIWNKFYTADYEHYKHLDVNPERKVFPKRFIFVGRYLPFKGIGELFSAFLEVDRKGWELYCAGTGQLFDQKPEHPDIHHLGFVQPTDLDNFVKKGGVFVLPSWKEPWGVVIHEFTSAGYPIICSEKVGAATAFLEKGKNGFTVRPKNKDSLKTAFEKMISLSDAELFEMGSYSKKLASEFTISDWVKTAKKILNYE